MQGSHIIDDARIASKMKNPKDCRRAFRDKSAMIVHGVAPEHVVVYKEASGSIKEVDTVQVELADGTIVAATHKSVVSVNLGSTIQNLSSVYYTPGLSFNTLPCLRLDEHGIPTLIAKITATRSIEGSPIPT